MKKFSKVLSLLLVFAMIVPGIAQAATVDAEEAAVVTRISGGNRYQTAANVSNQKFGKSKTVVLASGENWPDALAGTALAGVEGAPILLTAARRLHPDTKAELISLGAEKVIIVGGETVIPAAVADELKAMGLTVDRKEGLKREDTAVAAAKGMTSKTAIIANGYESFADALSAGAYAGMNGMPILFVRQNSVPAGTLEGLKALGIENVIIAGGTSAVSAKVQSELAAYNPTRIYGEIREETSLAFAEKFENNKEVIIANGYDYADALAGAALGAKIGAPVVLVNTNSMKTVVKEFIGENADKNHTVIGGISAVSNNVMSDIEEIIAPVEEDEFKVVSVSAINGLELEVTFSKPVDKTDLVDKVTLDNNPLNAPTADSLSEDGKVLTLTPVSGVIEADNDTLTVLPIKSADDEDVLSEKYVALFSYEDTVAPFVVKNEGKDKSAVITFNEKLVAPTSGSTGLSVDGVNYTDFTVDSTGKVLTINGLENGKTYNVEIVGAKDTKGNVANPVNLTVAPVEDPEAVKQDVTISASGNKVTLNFVKEVSNETVTFAPDVSTTGTYTLDGNNATEDAIQYSTDKKTVTIDAQLLGVMGALNFQETKVTVNVKEVGVDLVEKTVTLTADKTAPKLVSSKVINTTTDGKKLELNFDREVLEPTDINLTITHIDGIRQAPEKLVSGLDIAYAVDSASKPVKTTLVVDLNTKKTDEPTANIYDFEDEKSYTVKFSEGTVTDVYTNKVAESTTTFTVPKSGTAVVDPKAIITVTTVDIATHNTIKLTFDKALTNISAANFTLAGKALPTGTVVEFVTDKANVHITLPAGSIVTSGDYVLTIANVADAAGNTLDPTHATKTVTLKENVAPTVKSVTTPDSSTVVVTFSEGVSGTLNGVTLKINGTVVEPAADSEVSGTTLTLNLETVNELKTGDKVSVEFKDSDIVDTNQNKLADVIVTN